MIAKTVVEPIEHYTALEPSSSCQSPVDQVDGKEQQVRNSECGEVPAGAVEVQVVGRYRNLPVEQPLGPAVLAGVERGHGEDVARDADQGEEVAAAAEEDLVHPLALHGDHVLLSQGHSQP